MASFQAKIGWKRPRKKEKKNRFDEFLPDTEQRIPKNSKKTQKIKEYHQLKYSKNYKTPSQLLFKPKSDGKCREREKIKKNRSDVFLPDSENKIPKKQQKMSKN